MVDLMLQDARIPAARLNHFRFGSFIHAFHADAARTRRKRHQVVQAQAAFKIFNALFAQQRDLWIDDHLERHHMALALRQLLPRPVLYIFRTVLNYRQLNALANLRRGQPHARRGIHGLFHLLDQFADLAAADLVRPQRPRRPAQYGITGLDNGEWHGQSAYCTCARLTFNPERSEGALPSSSHSRLASSREYMPVIPTG